MLSANNLLRPQDGGPVTVPSQDMVLGSYYLTYVNDQEPGAGKVFVNEDEVMLAYNDHVVGIHAPIRVRRSFTYKGVTYRRLVDITDGSSSTRTSPRIWASWTGRTRSTCAITRST